MKKIVKEPTTMLFPVPVIMASCGCPGYQPNIITIAWVGTVCSQPPMVGISVRPERYSYDMLKESGEFVVNLPSASQSTAVDYCGTYSGRNREKFSDCKLTPASAQVVAAPIIQECPVNLECRVQKVVPLGAHDLFIGEIVAVQVSESVCTDGEIDYKKMEPMVFAKGEYWNLGSSLGCRGQSVPRK